MPKTFQTKKNQTIKKILTIIIIFFAFTYNYVFPQSSFNKETLENAIINYVKTENNCESKIEISQIIKPLRFQQKGVTATISHKEPLIGNSKILLHFHHEKELIHQETIRINVRIFAPVPVANKFIPKDKIINQNDITIQNADVTYIDPNSVPDRSIIVDKICKKGLPKGKVIQFNDLLTNSDVNIKKNDKVQLLHYSGAILIKTDGIAIESGTPGSIIKIKKGHQTLHGFIADDGNIIVEDRSKLINN